MIRDDVMRTLRENQQHLTDLGVGRIALFGSLARGEDRPDSDIDLFIELAPGRRLGVWEFAGIKLSIGELFDRPVDVCLRRSLKAERLVRRRAGCHLCILIAFGSGWSTAWATCHEFLLYPVKPLAVAVSVVSTFVRTFSGKAVGDACREVHSGVEDRDNCDRVFVQHGKGRCAASLGLAKVVEGAIVAGWRRCRRRSGRSVLGSPGHIGRPVRCPISPQYNPRYRQSPARHPLSKPRVEALRPGPPMGACVGPVP